MIVGARCAGTAATVVSARAGKRVPLQHLPVTAEFTMQAGRFIWGLPKYLVDGDCAVEQNQLRVALSQSGHPIVTGVLKADHRVPGRYGAPSIGWSTALEGENRGAVLQTPGKVRLRNLRIGRRGGGLAWGKGPYADDALRLRLTGTPIFTFTADAQISIGASMVGSR